MRSLRTRLILGIALVAIVPLGLALVLMSKRVETMVREESGRRLETGVRALQAEMRERLHGTEAKLGILSRDPLLRRLYLVRAGSARELGDYLAERRILLDLDYLEVDGLDSIPVATATGSPADSTLAVKLDLTSPITYDNHWVGTLRGGVLLDRDFLIRLQQRRGLDLVLFDRSGRLAASTLRDTLEHTLPPEASRATIGDGTYWGLSAPLELGASGTVTLTALTPTTPSDETIAALRLTAVLLALGGIVVAMLLGFVWSRQVSRPVERLAAHSRRLARGEWDEPISLHSVRELETLGEALDRMRADLVAYREKLVLSERHAAWSQMARKVAHEVKNPLTPIAISVADLKRSYDLQRPDFPTVLDQAVRTIAAEVDSLKRLLQEFSDFARFPAPTLAPVQAGALLDDLRALYAREIEEGRLAVSTAPPITLRADAGQLRQALVNLVKNGIEAVNGSGKVTVEARPAGRSAEFTVTDNGPGLTAEQQAGLFTPGFTTKSHGSGLGLTIVDRIVSEHGGTIAVQSDEGRGTTFVIRLPREEA
ncbi:MAG TPA: ATP-binding protein [Candidatus Eisenbacteria bacterium]|nr:ATP-binding protein [Candidatus Eisenbacteria bacterium]